MGLNAEAGISKPDSGHLKRHVQRVAYPLAVRYPGIGVSAEAVVNVDSPQADRLPGRAPLRQPVQQHAGVEAAAKGDKNFLIRAQRVDDGFQAHGL